MVKEKKNGPNGTVDQIISRAEEEEEAGKKKQVPAKKKWLSLFLFVFFLNGIK